MNIEFNNPAYQKPSRVSTLERGYWIALSRIRTLGAVQLLRLRHHFSSMSAAWEADAQSLRRAGLYPATIDALIAQRQSISPQDELTRVESARMAAVIIDDPEYPQMLKEIHDPPSVLYVKGALPQHHDLLVAVVGTRKATSYGLEATRRIVSDLCAEGVCIVSGLAYGIDTAAHVAACDAGGRTMAVLGSAVDRVYPRSNQRLAESLVDSGGAVISEFPPGTEAQKHHFPLRNRVIAGLSRGVVVIEGDDDSGSLITARLALESGREVMAVPGDIFRPGSKGPNTLIASGAQPVTSAEDVLHALNVVVREHHQRTVDNPSRIGNNQQSIQLNAEETAILGLLTREPLHVDQLVHMSMLPTSAINATLAVLEVRGLIRHLGGMRYARVI